MVGHKWYRAKDHEDMPNSFNCIYLLEVARKRAIVPSYHLMIKNGEITQIMNGPTHIRDNMNETWYPLEDERLIKQANEWIAFIEAKNLLSEINKRFIVSIKNNRLHKIWG